MNQIEDVKTFTVIKSTGTAFFFFTFLQSIESSWLTELKSNKGENSTSYCCKMKFVKNYLVHQT